MQQVEAEAQLDMKKEKASQAMARRARDKRSNEEAMSDDNVTSSTKKKAKRAVFKGKGEAKFCAYCHKMGRSQSAFLSHNETDCKLKKNKYNNNKDFVRGFSGDRRTKAEAQNQYEKRLKAQDKKIKELKKIMKIMHTKSSREAKLAAAKQDTDDIAKFLADNISDDEDVISIEDLE